MKKHLAVTVGAGAVVLGIALVFGVRAIRTSEDAPAFGAPSKHDELAGMLSPPAPSELESVELDVVPPDSANPNTSANASSSSMQTRDELANAALTGVVRDSSGLGIAGVELVWLGLEPSWFSRARGWDSPAWASIEASAVRVQTDSEGRFEFDAAAKSGTLGTALWSTHGEFRAHCTIFESSPPNTAIAIELERANPLRVRVEDMQGNPVVGATVTHCGTGLRAHDARDARQKLALRSFRARAVTGADGRTRSVELPGRSVLYVESDRGGVRPWYGDEAPLEEVVLRVVPTFSVTGRVRRIDGFVPTGPMSVEVFVMHGGARLYLVKELSVDDVGNFGAVELPVQGDESYTFCLQGGGVMCRSVQVSDPRSGEPREIELEAAAGASVEVLVRDETEAPIELADIHVPWWVEPSRGDSVQDTTDVNGRAILRGIRPGTCWIVVSASGFVSKTVGPIQLPIASGEAVPFELARAGRVHGRVTFRSQPVKNFDVTAWRLDLKDYQRAGFTDRADGTFELHDVPLGDVKLLAFSPDGIQSMPVPAVATLERGESVEIPLEPPASVTGRIVDALTLEPVKNATIQRYLDAGGRPFMQHGAQQKAAEDGTFSITGFSAGYARFNVSAPGYSVRECWPIVRAEESIDIGLVPLVRGQDLTVQLYPEGVADFGEFELKFRAPQPIPLAHFDLNGRARVEAAPPGIWTFELYFQDDSYLVLRQELREGRPWHVELPIGGQPPLEVIIVPSKAGSIDPEEYWVEASFIARNGQRVQHYESLTDDYRVVFDSLPGPGARIRLVSIDGKTPATVIAPDPRMQSTLRIELGGERTRLRVIDRDERGIPNVVVSVLSKKDVGWSCTARTGQDGRCDLPAVDLDDALFWATRADVGFGVPVDANSVRREDDEFILVLDPSARIALRALDHGVPQPAVQIELRGISPTLSMLRLATDTAGRVEFASLNQGEYVVQVASPGYWFDFKTMRADKDAREQTLDVFRLASLELHVINAAGARVSNVDVELTNTELNASVRTWIDAGRVPRRDLRTDDHGTLRIDGLPNGAYRWTIVGSSPAVSGSVVLKPSVVQNVDVHLP